MSSPSPQPIPVFRHNLAMQFTTAQLDDAYTWLCRRRRHFPSDADIWWFRRCYLNVRSELLQEINSGLYRFSPQQKIIKPSDKECCTMPRKPRIYYTETDKALMWDRWRKGDSLEKIAQLFGRTQIGQGITADFRRRSEEQNLGSWLIKSFATPAVF
jgi:hypothetical protein